MTENVENLVLEHMKRFQASLDRIERRLDELTTRQTETHTAVIALRRDQVNDAEISAHLQAQLDAVRSRLDRIENRLDLTN
jgi:DNA-directed RNA polymerase specialized sigma24 family protein